MKRKLDFWDICPHLLAMSDMGFSNGIPGKFGKAHTYSAECYAMGITDTDYMMVNCKRNGKCLIARFKTKCNQPEKKS